MIEKAGNPFNWHLPLYGALGAMIVVLPTIVFGNDIDTFLVTIVIAAIVCLILLAVLILKIRRQTLAVLAMIALFCAISWPLFKSSDNLRSTWRWLAHAEQYKATVLALPNPTNDELKHTEWDAWGFVAADTTVYLVFDPNDSLATAAKRHSPGKFSGIPCKVDDVHRLESHWYTVRFYTDTYWDYCN